MTAKRVFDIVVSLLLLPVVLPVMAVIALLVRVSSGPPVLYRSTRIGRHERPFTMLKFRTMSVGDAPQLCVTSHGDPRVTRLGAVLRRFKLDELPQLFNVLAGEMSLVGPRPEDPKFVRLYTPEERVVFRLAPGITGAVALRFRHEERLLAAAGVADVDEYYARELLHRKLALDLEYVRTRTLRGDVGILVRTLGAVVDRAVPPHDGGPL